MHFAGAYANCRLLAIFERCSLLELKHFACGLCVHVFILTCHFRICEPDDPNVRCLMLRMRANVLSAFDSDPKFIEVFFKLRGLFYRDFVTFLQELYEQSAALASSLPLQRSALMSLQSLRVSLGQYSSALGDEHNLKE